MMVFFSNAASPVSVVIFSVLCLLVFIVHQRRKEIVMWAVSLISGGVAVYGLKSLLAVPRPAEPLIAISGYGFPSGHAAFSTLFAALFYFSFIQHINKAIWRRLLTAFCVVVPIVVSYSRVYLQVHFPIDVFGGVLLAIGIFSFSLLVYHKL